MEHTFESLKKMTVAQLREIAEGMDHENVQGYTTLHKDDLVKSSATRSRSRPTSTTRWSVSTRPK